MITQTQSFQFYPTVKVDPCHNDVLWVLYHPVKGWASSGDTCRLKSGKWVTWEGCHTEADALLVCKSDKLGFVTDVHITAFNFYCEYDSIYSAVEYIVKNFQGSTIAVCNIPSAAYG